MHSASLIPRATAYRSQPNPTAPHSSSPHYCSQRDTRGTSAHSGGIVACSALQIALCWRHSPLQRPTIRALLAPLSPAAPYKPHPAGGTHASGPSGLPFRTPSHDLLQQQLLHCICTAGGHIRGNVVPHEVPDRRSEHMVSDNQLPAVAVRNSPTGPPNELRSLAMSCCHWVVLTSKPDSMLTWHASSLFLFGV